VNREKGKESKAVFFEKKNQKTFACSGHGRFERAGIELSFCFPCLARPFQPVYRAKKRKPDFPRVALTGRPFYWNFAARGR
jgi:hypothetical protein